MVTATPPITSRRCAFTHCQLVDNAEVANDRGAVRREKKEEEEEASVATAERSAAEEEERAAG